MIVFLVIYALFSLAGILFPVDREWYESLNKPDWTPSGRLIGTVWSVLFAFISLAAALVYAAYDMRKAAAPFWIMLIINYVFNQAFSYFQFTQKLTCCRSRLLFRSHYRSFAHLYHTANSQNGGHSLYPLCAVEFFAAYLAFTIYGMNH